MSNRQIVFRYYNDMWDKGDAALIDALLAPDFVFRGSLGAELRGRERREQEQEQCRAH